MAIDRAAINLALREIPDEVFRYLVDSKDVGQARSRVSDICATVAADQTDWNEVAHRLAGSLDCMMLYCSYANDSHPRDAMALLEQVWKPLGFRGRPRMSGQIVPSVTFLPLRLKQAEVE